MSTPTTSNSTAKPTRRARSSSVSARSSSNSSSLTTFQAMVELKQKILTSISKLAARDTYQIAVEELEKTIQSLTPETLPMLLNCLYDSCSNPKPAVKKECLHLLSSVCSLHSELTAAHLSKIIAQIIKRLKDSDSGVRDACRDTIGALSGIYLKGKEEENITGVTSSVVGLFVKPLFVAMGEQNKVVQAGAAMCMVRMVESAGSPPITSFQKLCPRICKLLSNSSFLAKASLLPVVSSLFQVGAIAPQSLESLLESIHDCLGSTDWVTRKAAAETLTALASHSSGLINEKADSTITVLENCRLDKIKPVRESVTEALQIWKKISGKYVDVATDESKLSSGEQPGSAKNGEKRSNLSDLMQKEASDGSTFSPGSATKGKGGLSAVVLSKKKAPILSDKDFNPEFFQRLERRHSVEVVVPRKCQKNDEEELGLSDPNATGSSSRLKNIQEDDEHAKGRFDGNRSHTGTSGDDKAGGVNGKETHGNHTAVPNSDNQSEGSFTSNRGNWSAIQRQLLQLERQQTNLMNMLQEFVEGSHDSMLTLEGRVRGLERVVEEMARDLSISSGHRGNLTAGVDDRLSELAQPQAKKHQLHLQSVIPLELQIEILKRLPVKSLARFKCVSKLWSSLIHSQGHLFPSPPRLFSTSDMDYYHSGDPFGDIGSEPYRNPGTSNLFSFSFTSTGKSSGVFDLDLTKQGIGGYDMVLLRGLILSTVWRRAFIYNPTTGQRVGLPPIKFKMAEEKSRKELIYFLGYDPVLDQYKVVCCASVWSIKPRRIYAQRWWVFVLEEGSSWKRIEFDYLPLRGLTSLTRVMGFCSNGVIYYLAYDDFVLSFDVRSEDFSMIEAPVSFHSQMLLIEYGGKPTIVDYEELDDQSRLLKLWVLEDAGKWSEKSLVLQPCQVHFFPSYIYFQAIGTTQNGEVVFKPQDLIDDEVVLKPEEFDCLLYYDLHKNDVRRVDIRGKPEEAFVFALMDTGENIMHLKI